MAPNTEVHSWAKRHYQKENSNTEHTELMCSRDINEDSALFVTLSDDKSYNINM